MNPIELTPSTRPSPAAFAIACLTSGLALLGPTPSTSRADETCSSPYMARIEGQEEFVYVWTLGAEFADGYGYDARVLPRKNVMLSSSFTGWNNYTLEFAKVAGNPDAMKQFGQSMVLWDFHTRQPRQIFHVPGAPLEIRWAWGEKHNYAFTATALTSKLWLAYEDKHAPHGWQVREVAPIGDNPNGVLPVDISLSADDRTLFVSCFGDGKVRVYDVSQPKRPRLIHSQTIGRQLNMVSQSWDGKRLYFTSSLLARWDKSGDDNEQFLRAFHWNGRKLSPAFALDFTALQLGRPHHMLFGSTQIGR